MVHTLFSLFITDVPSDEFESMLEPGESIEKTSTSHPNCRASIMSLISVSAGSLNKGEVEYEKLFVENPNGSGVVIKSLESTTGGPICHFQYFIDWHSFGMCM